MALLMPALMDRYRNHGAAPDGSINNSTDQAPQLPRVGEADTATLSAGEGPQLTQGLAAVGSCWLSTLCVCFSNSSFRHRDLTVRMF